MRCSMMMLFVCSLLCGCSGSEEEPQEVRAEIEQPEPQEAPAEIEQALPQHPASSVDPAAAEREMIRRATRELEEMARELVSQAQRYYEELEFQVTIDGRIGKHTIQVNDEYSIDVFKNDSLISPLRGHIEYQVQETIIYMTGIGQMNRPLGFVSGRVEYFYRDGKWRCKSGNPVKLLGEKKGES